MAKKQAKSRDKTSIDYSKMKAVGFLKFIALIFPLFAYVIITVFVFPTPDSGFIFLGVIGSFIFGLGLVDIMGYLDNSNLGIEVSGFAFALGGGMIGISAVIMYVPTIYSNIDEQQVSHYFLVCTVILVSLIYYIFFRGAMKRYIHDQGVSKSRISALLKGTRDFWLYSAANESLNLGWRYLINKLYIAVISVCGILHMLLGWSKIISPVIAVLAVVSLVFNIPMWSLVISTWNQKASRKNNGGYMSLFFGYLLPVGAIAATGIATINLLMA